MLLGWRFMALSCPSTYRVYEGIEKLVFHVKLFLDLAINKIFINSYLL